MKKIIYIFLLVIIALSSCTKEVLEKKPLDIISDAVVWNDPVLIDAYLTQCYAEMGFINDMAYGGSPWAGPAWFEAITMTTVADECRDGWEKAYAGKSIKLKADGTNFADWWGYPTIRKLNIFIEKMPDSPVEASLKIKKIAEARFLRAYGYFNMVKRYGGVPLITKPQAIDAPEEELFPERDKEVTIYDFIISEIDTIVNDLKDGHNDEGRPTKYAALALKSRAAMYAGSIAQWGEVQMDGVVGIPANKAPQYWQTSYDASKSIINSEVFSLYNKNPDDKVANFRNIFLDENNTEVIFSEIYTGRGGKAHSWDMLNGPYGYNAWACGGQSIPYLEMVEEFENIDGSSGIIDRQKIENGYLWTIEELFGNKDPRFHASILTQGSTWIGDTIQAYKGIIKEDGTITTDDYKELTGWGRSTLSWAAGAGPFFVLKYMDEAIAIVPNIETSRTDWIVFRYAEILLNLAEAAFELEETEEALDAVNQIRNRAGIAPLTTIDLDKIRHERKVELAFEGNRYWDVRRWRTAEVDLSKSFSNLRFIVDYTTRKFKLEILPNWDGLPVPQFYPRHYYMPITLERTNNNPNLVENPGY
ncbi:MAG: RagB/SusD family nutrient uptake outer membrane protein [Bacteroidota bacterium]